MDKGSRQIGSVTSEQGLALRTGHDGLESEADLVGAKAGSVLANSACRACALGCWVSKLGSLWRVRAVGLLACALIRTSCRLVGGRLQLYLLRIGGQCPLSGGCCPLSGQVSFCT